MLQLYEMTSFPIPTFLFSSLLIILFSLFFFFKLITNTRPNLNLPPSPTKLPIIGNLHQVGNLAHRSFRALSEKYGPLVLIHFFRTPTLVVCSEEIAKEIINNPAFHDRPQGKVVKSLFYNCSDIAFCSYGEYWREIKKLCVIELFSLKRVQDFHRLRELEALEMVEEIRHHSRVFNKGTTIDLSAMLLTGTNNLILRCAFGRKYERVDGMESFGIWAKRAMILIGEFNFEDYVPLLGWMDALTGFNARLRETVKQLDAFLDQAIDEHKNRKWRHEYQRDFLDILLHLQENGQLRINLSRDNLKAILMDIIVGGTDNSTTTMEWAMAELVKNPSLMKRVQEEVRQVVGKKPKIDDADVDKMTFLKCVVKETLRLHPSTMIPREASKGGKFHGYDIPPKTRVIINPWAFQTKPELWERPEEFVPERFMDNDNATIDFKGTHCQFMPFGGGRRVCPGISFAIYDMEYVLANLLCWFDWELPNGQNFEDFDMSETQVFGLFVRKKIPLCLVPIVWSPHKHG